MSSGGSLPTKRSYWETIGRVSVILAIIGSVITIGSWVYVTFHSTPQKTLDAYCNGHETGNAVQIYDQLSTRLQAQASAYDVQRAINADVKAGGVKTCTYSAVQQYSSTAYTVLTGTTGDGQTFVYDIILIQENGTWKIDSLVER